MNLYLKRNDTESYEQVVTDHREAMPINFVFESIENPANYVAETCYTVKLPICPENNRFFGNYNQLDSVPVQGGFDPSKKMDYMATTDTGAIVSCGTATLGSVEGNNYVLSLVGSQARIFRLLLNAGFDTAKAAEGGEYYLMGDPLKGRKMTGRRRWVRGVPNFVTASQVYASWKIDNPLFDVLEAANTFSLLRAYGLTGDNDVSEAEAFIATLIGFAPTAQGKYKDFESGQWLETGTVEYLGEQHTAAPSVLPVLCSRRNGKGEPVQEVEADGGLIEPQIGEYRSYCQQPFVYVSALWQLFKAEFAAITGGYTLNLDERWFNADNTDLRRLVYMLPQIAGATKAKTVDMELKTITGGMAARYFMPSGYVRTTDKPYTRQIGGLTAITTLDTEAAEIEAGQEINADVSLRYDVLYFPFTGTYLDDNSTYYYSGYNPLRVVLQVVGGNGGVMAERKFVVYPVSSDGVVTFEKMQEETHLNDELIAAAYLPGEDSGHEILTPEYNPWRKGYNADHSVVITTSIRATATEAGSCSIRVKVGFLNKNLPYIIKGSRPAAGQPVADLYFYSGHTQTTPQMMTEGRFGLNVKAAISRNDRSGAMLTLERLFGEIKPFDVLLQYSKMRHLHWLVDDVERTVTVKQAADYYADLEAPTDITGKVDRNVKITPLSWNARSVVFNFGGMECDYTKGYADRHGVEYGSKELITANTTTKETKQLFGGDVKASAMLSQSVVPIRLMADKRNSPAVAEVVPMPLNVSGGECADVSGNFYCRHDNGTWQGEVLGGWRTDGEAAQVIITDDAPIEAASGVYCWRGSGWADVPGTAMPITQRPVFNTVSDGGLSVMFARYGSSTQGSPTSRPPICMAAIGSGISKRCTACRADRLRRKLQLVR